MRNTCYNLTFSSAHEFVRRYRSSSSSPGSLPMLASACPGEANLDSYFMCCKVPFNVCCVVKKFLDVNFYLDSSPGWVCYAEKTHGSFILPHISSTKSPQQIMGSLVKDHLANTLGRTYVAD